MSHHSSFDESDAQGRRSLMDQIFRQSKADDGLHEAMSKMLGEYPRGKISPDDEGAIALEIGAKDKTIFIRFPKPVAWIGFTPDEAMQIAQSLIDYARKVGLTKPMSIRIT